MWVAQGSQVHKKMKYLSAGFSWTPKTSKKIQAPIRNQKRPLSLTIRTIPLKKDPGVVPLIVFRGKLVHPAQLGVTVLTEHVPII
jgi:hypothetical protein